MKFHRVFSKSLYKNLKLPLSEMTFLKDFVNDTRGDLYPLICKDPTCEEMVKNNRYCVSNGTVERMFTQFFPYATYEISFSLLNGKCGVAFHLPNEKAEIVFEKGAVLFTTAMESKSEPVAINADSVTMIVSCRPGAFDVYFFTNNASQYFHTFSTALFSNSNQQTTFQHSYVSLVASGTVTVENVRAYIDCGGSQADIRAICYENADVLYENGKMYFTASIRIQEGGFQGVFSWSPSTSNIELTGALFFDVGDGYWRNYLASTLIFNRQTQQWYIWTSSFEHAHILCYGAFTGEPRFGANVIDVTMMPSATDEGFTDFVGFKGDEDPDFYFDSATNKWNMAICRLEPESKSYRYLFFQSDNPFTGYKYIGQGYPGAETGGSFVKLNNEMTFICGNDFNKRSNYRIYTKNGMQEARFDFDDGGFRGWGTVIPLTMGSRKRYFWLTFDRHNGSEYNWSYGNIYCFEGIS